MTSALASTAATAAPLSTFGTSQAVSRPSASADAGPSSGIALQIVRTSTGFEFPSIYSFPPFFTKQPNPRTWEHQAGLWQQLILSYCRYHRRVRLNLAPDLETSELFHNAAISRRLRTDDIRAVVDRMVASSQAEWDPPPPTIPSSRLTGSALIYYLPPSGWADVIHSWIVSQGLTNSIMTLYELTTGGDLAHTTDFYELDRGLLKRALAVLVKQGKAQVFKGSAQAGGGVGDDGDGVKFF